MSRRFLTAAALSVLVIAGGGTVPALARTTTQTPAAESVQSRFEQDRQAILAMAGDYRVRFSFTETTAFYEGYEAREPSRSGGHEIVRVVEDRGDFISLQHLLVAEHGGQVFIIKHWRQDWTYQPETVLTYVGPNRWETVAVPDSDRSGAWSQTVWQVDDSPRYGGVGRWDYSNGVASWEARTLRPLARRDATRHPPYDQYDAMNRHVITPAGWVHEQDNFKIRTRDGGRVTVVHEFGVNTYSRFADYDVAAGDAYWTASADFWAGVRSVWDEVIAANSGAIFIQEEAEAGSVTGMPLLELGQAVADGETSTEAALAEARRIILEATSRSE